MNKDILNDMGYEDSIIFENPDYDNAIVGISTSGNVIYDYDLMIKHLVETEGMDEMEAADFVSYNTIRALDYFTGDPKPIVMFNLDE